MQNPSLLRFVLTTGAPLGLIFSLFIWINHEKKYRPNKIVICAKERFESNFELLSLFGNNFNYSDYEYYKLKDYISVKFRVNSPNSYGTIYARRKVVYPYKDLDYLVYIDEMNNRRYDIIPVNKEIYEIELASNLIDNKIVFLIIYLGFICN